MDLGLNNKKALITGSSRGIGFAIAKQLVNEGCEVCLSGRSSESLKIAVDELQSLKMASVYGVEIDLSKRGNSAQLVKQATECMGGLDVLVNNVGTNRRKPFRETTDQDWDELMETNFRGPLETMRSAIPFLVKHGGSVVFISSIFGREFGGKGMSLYHVSKSALISLSKSLAVEFAPQNVRVNTVAPGSTLFEGGSWDKRLKSDPEMMRDFIEKELPMGRLGKADELANAVVFLLSDKASSITGTCWNVDAGQSRSMI